MFPLPLLLAFLGATLLVVIAPGPDNLLAISRGLSQGTAAAAVSAMGSALGILFHTLAATLGLSLLLQGSPTAFWAIKLAGGGYLVWLGLKALRSHDLISTRATAHQRLGTLLLRGATTNILNPKPALFILAFLPQFTSVARGSVALQMVVYGLLYGCVTIGVFTVMGACANRLTHLLHTRAGLAAGLNRGAGAVFILCGLSVLALPARTT